MRTTPLSRIIGGDCNDEPRRRDDRPHRRINVSRLRRRRKAFYSKALEPLGYTLAFEQGEFMGFGDAHGLSLGVVRRDPVGGGHVAFACDDHDTVAAFYEAAIAAGGTDNGAARPAHALPRALLRRVRPRRRRQQHRSRLPRARVSGADLSALPRAEFAFPGPLRDELVASILAGTKTATAGLLRRVRARGRVAAERRRPRGRRRLGEPAARGHRDDRGQGDPRRRRRSPVRAGRG